MMSSGIGNFLRQYRQNNNLSRESFAEMLDISVAFLAAIELGTKKPAYDTLIKIIYVFLTIFLYLLKCPQSLIL